MENFVIIGAGNAGLTCAKTIRKYKPKVNITIISDEDYYPYSRCLLTYFIENKANERLLFEDGKKAIKDLNLNYIKNTKVEFINTKENFLKLSSGSKINYDKLFIGTGSSPKEYDFENDNSILVTTLRHINDAKKIKENFKKGDVAVIEGGGLVSLKTLLALYELGIKIYWIVKSAHILSFLIDNECAEIMESFVIDKGIKVIKNSKIIEIKNKIVKLDNGKEIKANGVIVGKGVKANSIDSDVKINFDDGYIVNEYFQTNIENIFAGGDCAKIYDKAHNMRWKVALWPIAGISGLYAGKNMINIKSKFEGAVPVNSFSVFENNIVAAGKKKVFENEQSDYYVYLEKKGKIFKKFIFDKNDNLKGFVFINDIFKSGVYFWEIAGGKK